TAPADGMQARDAAFGAPRNMVIDGELAVLFSDFSGHRIYKVNAYGVLTIVAGNGHAGDSPDGVPARQASLAYPTALAYDAFGGLYICDSQNRAVKRLQNDTMRTVARPAAPTGLSFDAAGNLYVADAGGGQVLRIQPSGAVGGLEIVARDVAAMPNGVLYLASGGTIQRRSVSGLLTPIAGGGDPAAGDNGLAMDARLRRPSGLARDASGNLYIADTANNRIRKITPGGIIMTLAAGSLNGPSGVAADASGAHVYVADTLNHRVQLVSFDTRGTATVTTLAGTGIRGFAGDSGLATLSQLDSPGNIALAPDGSAYIADTGNGRIRQVRNGVIRTIASGLVQPRGLAFDPDGNLYIATADTRLRILTAAGKLNIWPADDPLLNAPRGVSVAANGDILVADTGNHRVRRITSGEGRAFNIAGLAISGYSGDGGAALDANLNGPFDVLAGPDDSVHIADSDNHRVRELLPGLPGGDFEAIRSLTVLNAASLAAGPIAPSELLAVPGLPADATVTLNGVPTPVLRGADSWIVIPNEQTGDTVTIEAQSASTTLGRVTLALIPAAPAIFTQPGGQQAAALNADGSLNTVANGAFRNAIVSFYATGLGRLDESGAPLSLPRLTINGLSAEILYCGKAPGAPAILQINARVPNGFYPPGALPVVLTSGEAQSPAGVTLWVQ
ncbi:MAG: hypothetical protein ABI823_15315, partial [Bryobacteraceae bacterium]